MADLDGRRALVRAALLSDHISVREAAIYAVETWGDPRLLDLLEAHEDGYEWIQAYTASVVRDLRAQAERTEGAKDAAALPSLMTPALEPPLRLFVLQRLFGHLAYDVHVLRARLETMRADGSIGEIPGIVILAALEILDARPDAARSLLDQMNGSLPPGVDRALLSEVEALLATTLGAPTTPNLTPVQP
jgi:hypothetical protein